MNAHVILPYTKVGEHNAAQSQGVGHSHMHYQNNYIFSKIFHMNPQVTVHKIDEGVLQGSTDI